MKLDFKIIVNLTVIIIEELYKITLSFVHQ